MNKSLLIALAAVSLSTLGAGAQTAQNNSNLGKEIFEQASARDASPVISVFAFPQICDLEMINTTRREFPVYKHTLAKDLGSLTHEELVNAQTIALQRACSFAQADIIIEPIFSSKVYDKDNKTLYIYVSGYPAKYVNFRKFGPNDLDMVQKLYPHGIDRVQQGEGKIITVSQEGAK